MQNPFPLCLRARTESPCLMMQQLRSESCAVDRRRFLQLSAMAASTMGTMLLTPKVRADEKRWRVGIIGHTGQGDYGHNLDTIWLTLPQTQVVAFADADEAGRQKEQAKLPGVKAFADYHRMLDEVKPDIVVVAPRVLTEHREMILAAVAAGARGVYCEKPMCCTPAEADEIVTACEAAGTRLAIAHRNRYHPALPAVKTAIAQGAIGKLLEVRGRGKEDQRGGCLDLWVLGCHVIDLARYFSGDPLACSSVIEQGNRLAVCSDLVTGDEGVGLIAGDRLHARFDMSSGIPFFFDSIKQAGVGKAGFGLQLIGNAGIIDLRIDREPLAHLVPGNPFQPTAKPRPWIPISSAGVGKPEPMADLVNQVLQHQLAARELIAAISEKRPTLCDAQDGRAIVEMIHAVFTSHIMDGRRIPLPLASRAHPFEIWQARC